MLLNGVSQVHTTTPSLLAIIMETSVHAKSEPSSEMDGASLNTFCGHSHGVKHKATLPPDVA